MILALVTEALREAGCTAPPPEAEQGDWLRGEAEWSEPDEHGWVALVPVRIDVWVPKALVAWQVTLRSGGLLPKEWGDLELGRKQYLYSVAYQFVTPAHSRRRRVACAC